MSYHWEVRFASVPGFDSLPAEALKILPESGRISPKAVETFFVLCDTSSVPPGNYRTLLMWVINYNILLIAIWRMCKMLTITITVLYGVLLIRSCSLVSRDWLTWEMKVKGLIQQLKIIRLSYFQDNGF